MKRPLKKSLLIIAIILALTLTLAIRLDDDYPAGALIRFHVLANSDSAEDQRLKLLVKNDLVAYLEEQFASSQSLAESRQILLANLDTLQKRAENTLRQAGSDDGVQLQYGDFDFPVKYYGQFSLPAGRYEALRVIIGQGAGQNWWCVLFPPMCFVDENQTEPDELDKYTAQAPPQEMVFKWRVSQWWDKVTAEKQDEGAMAKAMSRL